MNHPFIIALAGAVIVVTAIGVNIYLWHDEAGSPPVMEQAGKPTVAQPAKPAKSTEAAGAGQQKSPQVAGNNGKPTFDVVRVTPDGNAVIAGRGLPGAMVTVIVDGRAIGEVRADERGEWVLVPAKPLAPGSRQ
ncbi:MAG: peptidoglycan-binding protein, partial [Rhodospirillaceae bacterium]